jgi:hypothetical protein
MRRANGRFAPLPTEESDPFGIGGITWQIDNILLALEDASKRDDAREYASLAAQLAVIVRPKLTPKQYDELSVAVVVELTPEEKRSQRKRALRREYERRLFVAARKNVADMLVLVSEKGLYAKKDESEPPTHDARSLALRE